MKKIYFLLLVLIMVFAAGCGQDAVIDDDTPDETIHTPTEDEADENGATPRVNPSGSEDHFDGYLPPEIPVLSEGYDFNYTLDNREITSKVDTGDYSYGFYYDIYAYAGEDVFRFYEDALKSYIVASSPTPFFSTSKASQPDRARMLSTAASNTKYFPFTIYHLPGVT